MLVELERPDWFVTTAPTKIHTAAMHARVAL